MPTLGHALNAAGHSTFRVFAPERGAVALHFADEPAARPMTVDTLGYWTLDVGQRLPVGTRYRLEVDGRTCPDPTSRRQPDGVHADSEIVEPRRVRREGWKGVAIADAIVYELHLGTFTSEGTLKAAQAKLPHLQELGITVIELLPLAAFPGERGWGYDGVYLYALHAPYGTYDDLADFIEAAHALGIAVVLDVVYNHFGPEGNYTGLLGPYTKPAPTPWGAAINLDGDFNYGVREFFLENVRYWIEEIGFDGLRTDAVSLMFDNMPVHLLRQITDLAHAIGQAEGRHVLMIAEHLRNNKYVTSQAGFHFDSQWNDDLNHAIFAFLTGERDRHYASFGPFEDVVKALQKGFVLDGTRLDKYRRFLLGTDGTDVTATEHVTHIQNHDQIGNRPRGDRMIATYGRPMMLLCITAVMASPFVPMLYMGEEYGETAPFLFFEDFGDAELIRNVSEGRRREYKFGDQPVPEPHDRETFLASKLQWRLLDTPEGREIFAYYRELVRLKRSGELGPRDRAAITYTGDAATKLLVCDAPATRTYLNLSDRPVAFDLPDGWTLHLASDALDGDRRLPAYGAAIFRRTT